MDCEVTGVVGKAKDLKTLCVRVSVSIVGSLQCCSEGGEYWKRRFSVPFGASQKSLVTAMGEYHAGPGPVSRCARHVHIDWSCLGNFNEICIGSRDNQATSPPGHYLPIRST